MRPPLSPSLVTDLRGIVGDRWVSTDSSARAAHSRDCWPAGLITLAYDPVPIRAQAVVWPGSPSEVARVLQLTHERRVPVVPYGAGSGLCGGTVPLYGGVSLATGRLTELEIDEHSGIAKVGAGWLGDQLEQRLGERGLTLGHYPASLECSTVGGWVAARGAGHATSRYGKIEDMVLGLEVVLPDGQRFSQPPMPRNNGRMHLWDLWVGAEGTLGVVTAAWLRVRPKPPAQRLRGLLATDVESGVEYLRRLFRAGFRPAVTRLYDPFDTLAARLTGISSGEDGEGPRLGPLRAVLDALLDPARRAGSVALRVALERPALLNRFAQALPGGCLLILAFEGEEQLIVEEEAGATLLASELGLTDLGRGPGEQWLARYRSSQFKQSPVFASGLFSDTLEVATSWHNLLPVYERVRRAVTGHAFVLARFSHAYAEGCAISFTMLAPRSGPQHGMDRYVEVWDRALEAVGPTGATLSHHHGIGMSKAEYLGRELGPGGMALLRSVKGALDPGCESNPGKLDLDPPDRSWGGPK